MLKLRLMNSRFVMFLLLNPSGDNFRPAGIGARDTLGGMDFRGPLGRLTIRLMRLVATARLRAH